MSPYRLEGPALISFSGGRTSGYMLRHILDAHGGALPADVHVTFANTGKERAETLDFVQECSSRWAVRIRWLEYDEPGPPGARFREVSHNSASRNGEPFDAVIARKGFLPNPVTRFCTAELKVRVMRDFARSLGWGRWHNVIGIRADEAHRLDSARERAKRERWSVDAPMVHAGVTEDDVLAWWREQPFDLRLQPHEGNCDLCFLKSAGKISRILRERPDLAAWWIAKERDVRPKTANGARFRDDRPGYAELLDAVQRQAEFDFGPFDELGSCGSNLCHD